MPTREPNFNGRSQQDSFRKEKRSRTSSRESPRTSTSTSTPTPTSKQDKADFYEDLVSAAIGPVTALSELRDIVHAGRLAGVRMREPYEMAVRVAMKARGFKNLPSYEEVVT